MATYTVTYRGENPPGNDTTQKVVYDIDADGQRFVFIAAASGSAAATGSLRGSDIVAVLRRAALEDVESRLAAGFPPEAWTPTGVVTEILYGPGEVPVLEALLAHQKECLWLEEAAPRGHVCKATRQEDHPSTTPALCLMCEMPDSALVCEALVFPRVHADHDQAGRTRHILDVQCEADESVGRGAGCIPGSKQCWRRSITTGRPVSQPDSGAPRRVVDEIGYLRLVYADHFRVRDPRDFWPTRDETSVASLLDACDSAKHFERHVVVLDDMLSAMKPHAQLEEHRRTNGTRIVAVTALGRVLDDCIDGANSTYVDRLRALKTARNSFSHEKRAELVDAMRRLGVEHYGSGSWQLAWWQVAASVADDLAQTRAAIHSASPMDVADA